MKSTKRVKDRKFQIALLIGIILGFATISVYWQVHRHEFVFFDDNQYVTNNYTVQAGLTKAGLIWAFTTFHAANWHPLTWLSHMLDCQLFGLNAGMHHLTNLWFHLANTLLLFWVFARMTGAIWRSAFVAALFALHPLHVESVAWVAERKDVLNTLFWLLTMWAYVRYAKGPGAGRYILVLILFSLGLMSKPMIVTLPLILLLVDYWPLARLRIRKGENRGYLGLEQRSLTFLIVEKLPLVALSGVVSVLTFVAQHKGGAVQVLEELPLSIRVSNALIAYATYVGKMLWPCDLAVLYPHPESVHLWAAVGSGFLLAFLSAVSIMMIRTRPYLATGWLWYLVSLVPVIGLVQVGAQSMADRYTYVPLIGLFFIIAWGTFDLVRDRRYRRIVLFCSAGTVIFALMICTWRQVCYWKDSVSLFGRALTVTDNNWKIHNNIGTVLMNMGEYEKAVGHFNEALKIYPGYAEAYLNLGAVNERKGLWKEAVTYYQEAIKVDPDYAEAHNNLGNVYALQKQIERSKTHYSEALRVDPQYANAHVNLGNILAYQGAIDEAIDHYSKALKVDPYSVKGHLNMGIVLLHSKDPDRAIFHFSEVLAIDSSSIQAQYGLARAYQMKGNFDKAVMYLKEALRNDPDNQTIRSNLEAVLKDRDGRSATGGMK